MKPGKYLGLPTKWGKSKGEAMGHVKSRILSKYKGGSNNFFPSMNIGTDKSCSHSCPYLCYALFQISKEVVQGGQCCYS